MLIAVITAVLLTGCSNSGGTTKKKVSSYEYGEDKTFHSDKPVTYTMMYSDNEAYPYKEDWLLWKEITKLSNVTLKLNIIARSDYDDKKSLLINAGQSPYIIPKTYDETAFITGGAILPISDYTQYMPNYTAFVKKYHMEDDLATITQNNGKYYRLPGMWEQALSDYSIVVRKDMFDKAGIDIKSLEKNLTWEEFAKILKKVQEANPGTIGLSDRWKGDALLQTAGVEYDVTAGWGKNAPEIFNFDTKKFEFGPTTQRYKDFLSVFTGMMKDGTLDPESFTQEDDQALQKFYTGKSCAISANRSTYPVMISHMNQTLGKGNFELYMIVQPGSAEGNFYLPGNSRLENGIMISTNALTDLGKDGFIKMLRFIDWLWYSDKGQTMVKWGVEGETYRINDNGKKELMPDIDYGGVHPDAEKKLNVDYGFSNGVFTYGGTKDLMISMFSPLIADYCDRMYAMRTRRPLQPIAAGTEDEIESMNLIRTPLVDSVASSTLQFIMGQKDLTKDWDSYVESCKEKGSDKLTTMSNLIYARNHQTAKQ